MGMQDSHVDTTDSTAWGSESCPRCTHPRSDSIFPVYSRLRAFLRIPQGLPYCGYEDEAMNAIAPSGSCGCSSAFHAEI